MKEGRTKGRKGGKQEVRKEWPMYMYE